MRTTLRRTALVAVTCLAAASCTGPEIRASDARAAAAQFVDAWSERDAAAMIASFDAETADIWTAATLSRWLDETLADGRIDSVEVALTRGATKLERDDDEASAEIPYAITYTSTASRRPVRLDGALPVVFDRAAEEWRVPWREAHMWPGIEWARGFKVSVRYLKRGTVVDRVGRPLARGAASERSYPYGAVGGTTVGHVEPLSRRDLRDAAEGRKVGDLVGGSGLEAAFEDRLAGEPATRLHVVDELGVGLKVVGRAPGRPGGRVRVTLDMRVQRAAEAGFGGTTGGAVVVDPATGDLLAVVSSASFNPAFYRGTAITPFNRALSGLYPPGSALKVMTATAALDTGVVTRATRLTGPAEYRGVRNFESGQFGSIDFATALKFSVNTAFAQVARRLGARRLTRYAERFGFNRPHDMALAAATSSFPKPEDEGDLMWGAIGQAQVVATPLQMATVAAAIANDGVRMEPRIDVTVEPNGDPVASPRTAAVMKELMRNVVVGGTGVRANLGSVSVAGKTGTAEVDVGGERLNHAWFIAFAPVERPEVAIAVVSELGGVGGQVAAPLARQILANVLPLVR